MEKDADAFRTISEVAEELELPQHVLRFWETRFSQIKPLKRAGGRRFYRPHDIEMLRAIKSLLYGEGYTIKGVQRLLKEQGARALAAAVVAKDAGRIETEEPETWAQQPSPFRDWEQTADEASPPLGVQGGFGPASSSEAGYATGSSGMVGTDAEGGGISRPRPVWPSSLAADDAAKLQAGLAELEECERILAALRRV